MLQLLPFSSNHRLGPMAAAEFLKTSCLVRCRAVRETASIASSQLISGSANHLSYYSSYPDFRPRIGPLIVDLPVYS